jgi:DNA-binding CsgD family transcriptional regulator
VELIERENEIHLLEDRMRQVAGGSGRVVLLGGEAGIGKTSLLHCLAQRRDDAALWWGVCDALQTPHPLGPLYDIARTAEVGFRALLAAEGDRAALFEAVLTDLQRSRRPTLAIIEDVHWADDATLDLLKFLARRIDRVACLLVISFRDDQLTATHSLRRLIGQLPHGLVTRIDVPRLSPAAVELMARRAFQSPEGVYTATQGNPFFVTELLRHGGAPVPRAVQDLVLARYAELGPQAQAFVRLTSVVPAKIERWLVERLLGTDVAPIEACLNSGLLSADATSCSFRHELARVAIESSMSEPVARTMHAAVLEALLGDSPAKVSLARLVHHAVRASDHAAVMRYAPEAAQLARQRGAYREAAAHYASALHHAESAGLGDDAERVTAWLEGYAGGCERADQLQELIAARLRLGAMHRRSGHLTGEAQNLSQLAMAYTLALRNADAEVASRQAIALLEPLPPGAALATAWRVQAHLRMLDRDHEEAIHWSSRSLELAERLGERETAILAINTLGAATILVDHDAGRHHLMRAFDMAMADGRYFAAANAMNNLAAGSCNWFRLREAQQTLNQALALCERDEFERNRSYYLAWLAFCEAFLGRWDEASARALDIVRLSSAWNTSRFIALVALGRVQARRGDPAAVETLDEALNLARSSNAVRHIGPVRAARAEAAFLRGDMGAVIEEASGALALVAERGLPWIAGELAYWLHRAGAGAGMPQFCAEPYSLQVEGRWAEAAASWSKLGCPYEEARALAEGEGDAPLRAWRQLDAMGARPAADALRQQLRKAGRRDLPRVARAATQSNPFQLTAREIEVLSLLCEGMKNAAIAERLVRSVRTVDHHLAAIYAKLGVGSRAEAVARALQAGIAADE